MDQELTPEDLKYIDSWWLDEYDTLYIQKENAYNIRQNRMKNEFLLTLQILRNKTRACVTAHVQEDRVSLELLTHSESRKGFWGIRDDDWYFISWLKSIPIPCESCI